MEFLFLLVAIRLLPPLPDEDELMQAILLYEMGFEVERRTKRSS